MASTGTGAVEESGVAETYLAPIHLSWLAEDAGRGWRELEASLLFADVSGFTRLGERLARRGRIGAEQLTDAINTVFGSMVDAVDGGGGELLKFGGDAILVLFAGPDHAGRAATTGLRIQADLARLRVLPGRGERLSVSAGIATGTAHLFLAGESPRELIVAGPLASEVVNNEGSAEAGEIVVSQATADQLKGAEAEAREDGRLLLRSAPAVHADPVQRPSGCDPRPGLPLHLHDHEPADGEHRTITVGFVQYKGSDSLLARDGPEALAAALEEIVGGTTEACRDWGITFVSSDVDADAGKLIVCAGAPTASADDDDRILHAVRSVLGRTSPLPLRAGVNRGPAFTGDLGPARRRVWSVMGDAVNLAARVMGRAEPGQVLATRTTLDRARDAFGRTAVEPFMVKGKSAPVEAEIVGEARGTAAQETETQTPLVGRDHELARLREAVAAARGGERRIIELIGEPGIGKSRLVEALLDEAEGLDLIRIQAGPYGAHSPYLAMRGPMRELIGFEGDTADAEVEARVRELVGSFAPELEPWLPLIAIPFGLDLPPTPQTSSLQPEFARQRLNAAVAHALDLLLPDRPTLAVIEDAHWLDEASGDLLRHLVTADRSTGPRHDWGAAPGAGEVGSAGTGLAAIVTRRDVPEGMRLDDAAGLERLPLAPLAPEDALELVAGQSAGELPPHTRQALLERSEGNPLLLGELVAAVRAGHSLDELPETVEALMTARIDSLPAAERSLLREASILGVYVPIELLGELTGKPRAQLTEQLGRLGEFLLPEDEATIRFRHELLRGSAYSTLSFRRRRKLHARAGEKIEAAAGEEAASQSELLAIHFHAAGLWQRAWRYSRLAGERAQRRAAPVEAIGFFGGALEAARHLRDLAPADRAEVAIALGGAAELAGEYEQAADAYSRARKLLADDPLSQAELCLRQGQVAESSKHLSSALRWFTRGLGELEKATGGERSDSLRARLTLSHGATRLRSGRLRECLPYLDRAVDLAESCGDRAALARAYYLLDWAHTDLGHTDAERFRDLALPIYEELEDHASQGRVLNNLGVNAQYECRWAEAVEFLERSRAAAAKAGDVVEGVATAVNNIGEIRLEQGRLDEADELLREALAIWRGARYPIGIGTALKNLGRVATKRGELERARELLAEARSAFEGIGSLALVAETDAWQTELLLSSGELEEARALLARVEAESRRVDLTPAILAAVERLGGQLALAIGKEDAGVVRLLRSLELAREAGSDLDEALALLELADLGPAVAADGSIPADAQEQATEMLGRLGVVSRDSAAAVGS